KDIHHRDTEKKVLFLLLSGLALLDRVPGSMFPEKECGGMSGMWEAPQCADSGEPLIERPLHWACYVMTLSRMPFRLPMLQSRTYPIENPRDWHYNLTEFIIWRISLKNRFHKVIPVLFLVLSSWSQAQTPNQKIALTFDDLPGLRPSGYWRPREISRTILRTLADHQIQAAGFVVGEKIDDDLANFVVIEDWASQGHLLGNQTHADVDLNELSSDEFLEHLNDGQNYLRRLSRAFDFNYRYIRFPFLHQGNTERNKNRVTKALYKADYQIAHVTVKTSDYRFNQFYVEREGDPKKLSQLKTLYLEHITQSLEYAESQSEKVFGRNINHVLWLRAGLATAQFLEDLIGHLSDRGYQFISLTEALLDPAFQTEETYVGPLGLSFTDRVAASRGLPFDSKNGEMSRRDLEKLLVD
ncbi:MAG: polysaccharide deacetylase family protein, partial [Acidobacteriota bacterium]